MANLFSNCKKYLFSCASSKYAGDCDEYEGLDRPTNKFRSSKIKFTHAINRGKKLANAESSVRLNIDGDDEN